MKLDIEGLAKLNLVYEKMMYEHINKQVEERKKLEKEKEIIIKKRDGNQKLFVIFSMVGSIIASFHSLF